MPLSARNIDFSSAWGMRRKRKRNPFIFGLIIAPPAFFCQYILSRISHELQVLRKYRGSINTVRDGYVTTPQNIQLCFAGAFCFSTQKYSAVNNVLSSCGCFIGQNQNNSAKEPSLPKRKFLGNNGSFCVLYSFLVLRASRPGIPPIKFCDFARGAVKIYAQIYLQAPAE